MRSIVKKWQKLARVGKVYTFMDAQDGGHSSDCDNEELSPTVPQGHAVVYVGKSRRRYVINCRHLQHPLFKALWERSEQFGIDQSLGLALGCEVVLFEHLLWMLDSADPAISLQGESVHELAELYMPSDNAALFMLLEA